MPAKRLEILADDVLAARSRLRRSRFQSMESSKSDPPLHGREIRMPWWYVTDMDCRSTVRPDLLLERFDVHLLDRHVCPERLLRGMAGGSAQ